VVQELQRSRWWWPCAERPRKSGPRWRGRGPRTPNPNTLRRCAPARSSWPGPGRSTRPWPPFSRRCTPYTLHTTHYTLHTSHYTNPTPTLHPTPHTLHPSRETLNTKYCIIIPKPETRNPKPQTPKLGAPAARALIRASLHQPTSFLLGYS